MKPFKLPGKVEKLSPYKPLTGNFRLRLDANESFLQVPDWLREKITSSIQQTDFRRYPDPNATALCQSFAEYYSVAPAQVVAGSGSDELIGLLVTWFLSKGDAMVVVPPDFSMYSFYAQTVEAVVRSFPKDETTFAFDPVALANFVAQQNAKLLMLSNPCNPTSVEASRETLKTLLARLPEDCLTVVDEAYMEFATESVMDLIEEFGNLLVLKTCSKAFGMAAIRLGFAVAQENVVEALRRAKSPFNVNEMTQRVGQVLFAHPDYLRSCTETIKEARNHLYRLLTELSQENGNILQVYPTRANFVLLKLREGERAYEALLRDGIAVRRFGDVLRITAGSAEENAMVTEALRTVLISQEKGGGSCG